MSRKLLAGLACATAMVLGAPTTAFAEPTSLEHSGQGVNDDGTCAQFEQDDDNVTVGEGEQAWHFVLTSQGEPGEATMDADFDDGTSVSGQTPAFTSGQVAHFYVITSEGAALTSATAHFDSDQAGGNPQFTVSHCVAGENGENGENGDESTATPAPVPTDVPAGLTSADGGSLSGTSMLAGAVVVVAVAGAVFVARRLMRGV